MLFGIIAPSAPAVAWVICPWRQDEGRHGGFTCLGVSDLGFKYAFLFRTIYFFSEIDDLVQITQAAKSRILVAFFADVGRRVETVISLVSRDIIGTPFLRVLIAIRIFFRENVPSIRPSYIRVIRLISRKDIQSTLVSYSAVRGVVILGPASARSFSRIALATASYLCLSQMASNVLGEMVATFAKHTIRNMKRSQ